MLENHNIFSCKSKVRERCRRCRLHPTLCICDKIPTYHLATKIVLIMHKCEVIKVSATGPLALECLPHHELLIHGFRDNPLDITRFNKPERRLFTLFPSDDSRVLTDKLIIEDSRPITLVVPDGNWGQASRMTRRIPGMQHVTPVTLPTGPTSRWGLRKAPHEGALATFEAIAYALGIIESQQVQEGLMVLFDEMVRRVKTLRPQEVRV